MKKKLINKVKDKKFNTEYLVTILLMLLLLWGIIYGVLFISRNISENGVYSFILFKTYKGDFLSFFISFIMTALIFLLSGFFLSPFVGRQPPSGYQARGARRGGR